MDGFEALLRAHSAALERYVRFRVSSSAAAEDLLQEICLSAYLNFSSLRNPAAFQSWLLQIARSKCGDYFRKQVKERQLQEKVYLESKMLAACSGAASGAAVREILSALSENNRQILYLVYWRELPQKEIARLLQIPEGTVKSRLYTAKQQFKKLWEQRTNEKKGEWNMNTLPKIMPDYTVEQAKGEPFAVCWEEIMGWFIVPKIGETLQWAMYDFPERIRTERMEMKVLGPAEVHGIRGVQIRTVEYDPMECNSAGGQKVVERNLIAQLTDTHCRILAESHKEGGVQRLYTFLDGDPFLDNWGFGEDNCGNEIHLKPKGEICRSGNIVTAVNKPFLLDVVGRYTIAIGGKRYDTVCVMDIGTYIDGGVVTEQFLDENGRTILWRRFNHDTWTIERYGTPWSQRLPENETLMVNGEPYVHWYDCITDYIL